MQDLAQENMPPFDEEIIRRVLAGEKRAYAELVDRHKDKAMTLALRMLRNREEAEEAIQDAFVRAFRALPRFEWNSSFSTWFYRIVYNTCVSSLGRRAEATLVSLDDDEVESVDAPSDDPTPEAQVSSQEIRSAVQDAIESLPESYAGILTLFFVNDMSYQQIVEVTGLSLSAVKVRLFRGRVMLRRAVTISLGASEVPSSRANQEG